MMAVYLNRTLSSIMSGNPSSQSHETNGLDRSLHNNIGYENSPLQIFVKAKKKINDIFGEIEEYVVETARFMNGKRRKLENCILSFYLFQTVFFLSKQITIVKHQLLIKLNQSNFKAMCIELLVYVKC